MKIAVILTVVALAAAPWCINAYKFANCDFEANYKCEIIHGAGVFIPPSALLTVWFGSDA